MKKLALALLAMTLLAPASPAFAAEEGESSARACTEPEAVWDYTAEEMTRSRSTCPAARGGTARPSGST